MKSVNIVYLYTTVVGHVVGVLKALIQTHQKPDIDVVFWDRQHANSSRYVIPDSNSQALRYHVRSSLTNDGLLELLRSRNPDIIYVSGWVDKGYLWALRRFRDEGGRAQVVCGIDDQWKGSLRQYVGRIYFRLFYRQLIDFMWVSGKPQYHYAERFGYGHENIISNLLSADTSVFNRASVFSKRLVFVGRFAPVKGLDLLLDAYQALPEPIRAEWPLVLIGDGSLREEVEKRATAEVIIKPFLQPDALMEELMQGGVACVPSYHEQWGLVIHEMALLGYPLLVSSACGAATEFLISGYNGYLFRAHQVESLRATLLKICALSSEELARFSRNSQLLGQRITPEQAAYSLLSVLDHACL